MSTPQKLTPLISYTEFQFVKLDSFVDLFIKFNQKKKIASFTMPFISQLKSSEMSNLELCIRCIVYAILCPTKNIKFQYFKVSHECQNFHFLLKKTTRLPTYLLWVKVIRKKRRKLKSKMICMPVD